MQIKDGIDEVLHKIHVKLYPNYLQSVDGKYTAKTDSEATLGVKEVCGTAITRGKVDGITHDKYTGYAKQYLSEVAYQLCDGYAVDLDFFSIHPGVGLFLVPVDNPSAAVKVTRMAENSPTKLTGTLPASTGHSKNKLEICTQFSGTEDRFLKELRVISSPFTLEEV
jgi:hypothetical protein